MFIRTKDSKILDYQKMNEITKLSIDMDLMEKEIDFKFADTIEELCDEFVLLAEDYDYFQTSRKVHRHWVFDDLADTEQKEDKIGKGISRTIYGAIWTEKGLIYVAKMNEKGELELL